MLNPNSHLFQRQYQQRYKTDKSQKKLVLHIQNLYDHKLTYTSITGDKLNKQKNCLILRVISLQKGPLVLTCLTRGLIYITFKSIFHKASIYFSLIVKSHSNLFLEPTSTKQQG